MSRKSTGGVYLFISEGQTCFIVIKSGSKNMAKERLKFIVNGQGIYNWSIYRLDEERTKQILAKYELDCLYKQDADYSAAEGLIAHA
jgi:2-hydroxy-3-keto-5-methylthiopentenyl-1-phosphate phosphatase